MNIELLKYGILALCSLSMLFFSAMFLSTSIRSIPLKTKIKTFILQIIIPFFVAWLVINAETVAGILAPFLKDISLLDLYLGSLVFLILYLFITITFNNSRNRY